MSHGLTRFGGVGVFACSLFAALSALAVRCRGYKPPVDTAGPLTAIIEGPSSVTRTGTPFRIGVLVQNHGPTAGATSRLLGTVERQGTRYEIRLYPGLRGLLDSTVALVSPSASLYMHGFRVRVLGDALEDSRSACQLLEAREEPAAGRYSVRHRFHSPEGGFDVLAENWIESGALRTRFWVENAPAPRPWLNIHLEEIAPGSWSERAVRVYVGVGNVVQDPQPFQVRGADGQQDATSFAGFDFANGISVVQGVDAPPEVFKVDPAIRAYSLHTAAAQTLTLIPSPNIWETARIWHDLNGLNAAGGVPKLAGQFSFDLWGRFDGVASPGYREAARSLLRAFRYGLTDSIVIWHQRQRWGYDYRLPDIYPPDQRMDTLADFVDLVQACKSHGVLFAPHDNYIDMYPDATDFSYADVAFNPVGQPVRAYWNAASGGSGSYRLRPDRSHPYIARNLEEDSRRLRSDRLFPRRLERARAHGVFSMLRANTSTGSTTATRSGRSAPIRDYLETTHPSSRRPAMNS